MKKYIYCFTIFISLIACGDESMGEMEEASMTVIKDGVSHDILVTNNTLVSAIQSGREGRRLDIRCNVDGGLLVLTVSNWDFQNPPVDGVLEKTYVTNGEESDSDCLSESGFTFCDGGGATYLVDGTNVIFTSEVTGAPKGEIRISKVNESEKTVSGTFDLTTTEFASSGSSFTFSGSFTNLSYLVM